MKLFGDVIMSDEKKRIDKPLDTLRKKANSIFL